MPVADGRQAMASGVVLQDFCGGRRGERGMFCLYG